MGKEQRHRPPGRPRNLKSDQRILNATLEAMARDGYSRMSIDAIARRARVTKPTIYRRWPSKEDLATAALAILQAEALPDNHDGSKASVIAALRHFQHCLLRPNGMAMIGTLLAEEKQTPALMIFFRERITIPRRKNLLASLEAAQQAGVIIKTCDVDAVTNMLIGSVYAKYLLGQGVPINWPDRVVDSLWSGIATSEPKRK